MPGDMGLIATIDEPDIGFHTDVDVDAEIAFFFREDSSTPNYDFVSVDISDPQNPQIADKIDSTLQGAQELTLRRMAIDPSVKRAIINKEDGDSGEGLWLIAYDANGSLTFLDREQFEGAHTDLGSNVQWTATDPSSQRLFLSSTTADGDFFEADYSNDTIEVTNSFALAGGGFWPVVNADRRICWAFSTRTKDAHILDISTTPATVIHSTTLAFQYKGRPALDPDRDLVFAHDDGADDFVILEWDGSSINEVGRLSGSDAWVNHAYTPELPEAHLQGSGEIAKIDVSDETSPQELNTQGSWPNSGLSFGINGWLTHFDGGDKLVLANRGSDSYFATVNTNVSVSPDKPTISVDATGDEYADLSSSAYSHPQDTPHQDSRWQVRQATANDWTNPEYDSGWTSSDLEAHTANPIPIEDDLEARVAHRDTNGNLTWSDPVTLSTTGTIKQGEGPEGLFFGEKNGNRILRFGRAFQDDGQNIKATLESNHVAPAGAQGEAVFRSLYITVETGTDVDFTFTPIIDGTEDTNARVTHQHRPASKTRDTIEVALAKDVTDSAGNPVAKVGLRGSWFGVKIEATDVLGSGNKVNLEGVELEVETVREQAGSVNEV